MKILKYSKTVRRILLIAAVLTAVVLLSMAIGRARKQPPALADRQARIDYLAALGFEAAPDSEQRQEILLPREFDDVLENYNELQKQQGFDLSRYAGQSATLYSYTVTNWPDPNATVIVDLYCRKGRVIAGDVHSTALNGFMFGLK